jgi:hypothetical protein
MGVELVNRTQSKSVVKNDATPPIFDLSLLAISLAYGIGLPPMF